MLDYPSVDARCLFSELRMVIVDETHAFAGNDRGWHLLSVLERISRLTGRKLQRLRLSSIVGNPQDLFGWLAGSRKGPRDVFLPPASGGGEADLQLDFVGSLHNAAVVISRLQCSVITPTRDGNPARCKVCVVILSRFGDDKRNGCQQSELLSTVD